MPSRDPSPEQLRPFRSGPIRGSSRFALFGPAGPASETLTDKKDPLRHKESNKMEPSGFEPLTPCMPCRRYLSQNDLIPSNLPASRFGCAQFCAQPP